MARAAVALVLLGLATAFAQTYVLDTQQPQKVWLGALLAICHQPHMLHEHPSI